MTRLRPAARPARLATALAVVAAAIGVAPATSGAAAPPRPPACPATVGAPSAIVVEVSTGDVVCARDADRRRPIASTTKLMTALLTLERAKLDQTFTASRIRPASVESQIGLLPGERMRVRDLLRGLLVTSANDAANTLAEGVAGSERAFVRLMNERARQLGLTETRYANPVGLDEPGNYSSARDLVRLATVLRANAFFRQVVDSPQTTLQSGLRPRTFRNRNLLVRSTPWVNGVKTGHTRGAGYVLVGSGRRHGIQVVSAVLGDPSERARDADSLALLELGVRAFRRVTVPTPGAVLARRPIRWRRGAELALVAGRTVRRVVPRGRRDLAAVSIVSLPAQVEGPIREGQRIGTARIVQGGRAVATIPLVAADAVPAADIAQRTKAAATRWPVLLLLFVAAAGSVLLAQQRRAGRGRRGGTDAEPRSSGEARAA